MNMKNFQKATVLFVLIFSLVFLNLTAGEKKIVDKSFKAVPNVKIKVVSGDCVVTKGGKGEIKVHLEYTFDDSKYTPIMEVEGNTLILKEEFAKHSNTHGSSSWSVTVPATTAIEAKTASGDISVTGLTANVHAKVASGDITIKEIGGKVSAHTASGDVSLTKIKGDMTVKTASGDIKVNDSIGALDLNCASGEIEASVVEIKGISSIKAVSGDLEIKLAKTCDYNLDLRSVSGDITLDYNGNAIKGYFKLSGPKDSMDCPFPLEGNSESKYSPFVKKTFKKGSDSPVITMKTISGELKVKK